MRIVGANAVDQSQDKTDVSVDFVPLNTAFDNTTAHLLASRFWSGQIPLNTTLFGVYSVNFVKYPGTSFALMRNQWEPHYIRRICSNFLL